MPSLDVSSLSGKVYSVSISEQGRVEDLKKAIECTTGIVVDEQRLVSTFGELSDGNGLAPWLQLGAQPVITLLRRDPLQALWLKKVTVGELLINAPPEIRADKEVVLRALDVLQWGRCIVSLQDVSAELRADREVVLKAVQHGASLRDASPEIRADREVVLSAVLSAVQRNGMQLEFASDELRGDREVVLHAMQRGGSLRYASPELRADRNVVQCACSSGDPELQFSYACEALRADREFVLKLLRQRCDILPSVSADLKADHEVILSAMQHGKCYYNWYDGVSIDPYTHASLGLRGDWDFLCAAVRCRYSALRDPDEEDEREHFLDCVVDLMTQGPPEVPPRHSRCLPWYNVLLDAARKDVFRDAGFRRWALAEVLDLASTLQDHVLEASAANLPRWLRLSVPMSSADWESWFQGKGQAVCADHRGEHERRRQRAACRKVARGARVAAKKARIDREIASRPSLQREAHGRRRPERRASAAFAWHFDLAAIADRW